MNIFSQHVFCGRRVWFVSNNHCWIQWNCWWCIVISESLYVKSSD